MILYLDTSAVVKLYATEPGSAETERLVTASRQVASSLIAYAETRAALARKFRMRQMNQNEFNARKDESSFIGPASSNCRSTRGSSDSLANWRRDSV